MSIFVSKPLVCGPASVVIIMSVWLCPLNFESLCTIVQLYHVGPTVACDRLYSVDYGTVTA
jgi:hypothetical protein